MTTNELTIFLDKVKTVINNYNSYYVWYSASSEDSWDENGSYVTFEVFGHSDQDEGSKMVKYIKVLMNLKMIGYDKKTTNDRFS